MREKSKGCSQKTSGRSYSLKHPVARHFVCLSIKQAIGRSQGIENKGPVNLPDCRNCSPRGKNYFADTGKNWAKEPVKKLSPATVNPVDFVSRRRQSTPFEIVFSIPIRMVLNIHKFPLRFFFSNRSSEKDDQKNCAGTSKKLN